MSAPRLEDWIRLLEELYPAAWAEDWDNPGLQVGDPRSPAPRALVALDTTAQVLSEATDRGCDVVISHHPLVFRPLDRLDLSDPVAGAAVTATRSGVSVVACHTNADVARPGVSDALAEALGVEVTGVLRPTHAGARVKVVTFCPPEATAKVLDAVAGAGGGVIGEYSHCSFRVRGTGTFLPSELARPAVGESGELNQVEEDRLEMVVPTQRLAEALRAMIDAHPYEEVAHDVYPLAGGSGLGLGRVGRLPEPLTAGALAELCTDRLSSAVRLAGDPAAGVATVAVCGGSGGSLVAEAASEGVDAFVTGDLKHHQALDAAAAGVAVIDAGHHGTEWPFVPRLAERLRAAELGDVLISRVDTAPWR